MRPKVVLTEGTSELEPHEVEALIALRNAVGLPGYLIPSLMVGKLVQNREIDAVLILPEVIFLVELKHYTGKRIEVDGLNTKVRRFHDDGSVEELTNPCYNLAISAKVLSDIFKQVDIKRIHIAGLWVFTNSQLQELRVAGRLIGKEGIATLEPTEPYEREDYALLSGVAVCRLPSVSNAIDRFRQELESAGLRRAYLPHRHREVLKDAFLGRMTPLPPDTLRRVGSYIVDDKGPLSGEAYELLYGHQAHTNLPVWLKKYKVDFLSRNPDTQTEFLLRGARALSELGSHPHLPTYQDYYETGPHVYVILKREPGQFLRWRMEDEDFSLVERLCVLRDALDGLAHIHNHREGDRIALYRDMRPESIFVCKEGKAQLFNFDCSRLPGAKTKFKQVTQRAWRWSSYASYELLFANSPEELTPASDIYSWAVVAYELLTGQLPYAKPSELVKGQITPLARFGVSIPQDLQTLIEGALTQEAKNRPAIEKIRLPLQRAIASLT